MDIEIHKAEISSRIFLKWEYTNNDGVRKTKIKASADAPIHEDLEDAFQALVPHFVLVTEMKKKQDVVKAIDLKSLPEALLKKYKVTGIQIDENKGDKSYIITGFKILNTGKTVAFPTPKIRVAEHEDNRYEFIDKLEEQIEVIKDEVLEYMDGKEAVRQQTSMDLGDEFDPDEASEEETKQFEETAA